MTRRSWKGAAAAVVVGLALAAPARAVTGCSPNDPSSCSDNNLCTTDVCDTTKTPAVCTHVLDKCDDDDPCTDDVCDPANGACSFPAVSCGDNNPCTTDACDPAKTGPDKCTHVLDKCTDDNPCTLDVCDPATGACSFPAVNCSDNDLCTLDKCDPTTGQCVFTPKVTCDDGNKCTADACDPKTGTCTFTPIDIVCNDGDPCTEEKCDPTTGMCKSMGALDCNDDDKCTNDACVPGVGCTHTNVVCVDNDLCTDDVCVPATGCTFPDSSARCDDGDTCTIDSCDPQQGCLHVPSTEPGCKPLHHFQCYEAKPFAFAGISGVSVQDRYGSQTVQLGTPHPFCLPSDKRGEDPTAPADPQHLLGYPAAGEPLRVANQTVTNQFGTVKVDITRRTFLMVPTAKSLTGPTAELTDPDLDHFQCYLVKKSLGSTKFVPQKGIAAVDQFGAHTVDLVRPRSLCVPANKNGENPLAASHTRVLLCYKARHAVGISTTEAFTNNQFGPLELTLTRRLEFCVPSLIK
ncbi:MAG TPA: hypothetical protein VMS22_06510 [Candidatus Eisenbacteria bacterium]|nr:hypothetical protein [Candidatus Eisenbacteria bacterium]